MFNRRKNVETSQSVPERARYTKYYEHDGQLRAYANRSMLMAGLKPSQRAPYHRRIQMIHQDPYSALNPTRTIGQILADPLALRARQRGADRQGSPPAVQRPAPSCPSGLVARGRHLPGRNRSDCGGAEEGHAEWGGAEGGPAESRP